MFKKFILSLAIIGSVLLTPLLAFGENPPGAPEPASTALVGSALVTLFYKATRK